MLFFYCLLNVLLALSIAALAARLFVPVLKRLLAGAFPADIVRPLLVFAAAVLFIAALSGLDGISDRDMEAFRYGAWNGSTLFLRLCATAVEMLGNVAKVLGCILVVAIAAYLLSARRSEGDGGARP